MTTHLYPEYIVKYKEETSLENSFFQDVSQRYQPNFITQYYESGFGGSGNQVRIFHIDDCTTIIKSNLYSAGINIDGKGENKQKLISNLEEIAKNRNLKIEKNEMFYGLSRYFE